MRRSVIGTLVASAVLLSGCSALGQGTSTTVEGIGASAPVGRVANLDFTGTTLTGKAFHGASLRGRPVVLWFWAPWCTTCLQEEPNVVALSRHYAGRVSVVGVSSLATVQMIDDIARQIPSIINLVDPHLSVWNHFGVQAQSTYLVLDRNARVVASGYLEDAQLNNLVARIAAR